MDHDLEPCPQIEVIYWDMDSARVDCPYCLKTHTQGLRLPGKRCSHCWPGGQYEISLPKDGEYEIDKKRARFVSAAWLNKNSSGAGTDEAEDESGLADTFLNLSISRTKNKKNKAEAPKLNFDIGSKEMMSLRMNGVVFCQIKSIDAALSDCVLGKVSAVEDYLDNSTEVDLFLHGTDEHGNTTLILAAAEKTAEMVSLLLQRGAKVDAANECGRTALMEAALWGRRENVKLLLKAGVAKYMRDCANRRAVDLARDTDENREERYRRLERIVAARDLPERNNDRRYIAILLEQQKTVPCSRPSTDKERVKYGFTKFPMSETIALCAPIKEHSVSDIRKTAAVLIRGTTFPKVYAISGWGQGALPDDPLSGPTWIDLVRKVARGIGHKLSPKEHFDQGQPGRYQACHSEKKLIVYFIDKHYFWREEAEPDPALEAAIADREITMMSYRLLPTCVKALQLERRKEDLELELSEVYDPMVREGYDKQKVQRLKQEISNVNNDLDLCETGIDVIAMRSQQKKLDLLLEKQKKHQRLLSLSGLDEKQLQPQPRKQGVILTSNGVCDDCEEFKNKVNERFDLNIELHWQSWKLVRGG